MWERIQQSPPFVFVEQHETLFWWLAVASALMFVGSLIVVPWILVRLPADYFNRDTQQMRDIRTPLGWVVLIGKNLLGGLLLLAGIALLLLPGQGVIAILVGISLMNFPGKRRLEQKIVKRPSVSKAINWLRTKAGKEPLQIATKQSDS